MDSSAASPSPGQPISLARRGARDRMLWLVFALAALLYLALLATHMGAYAGGSDSSGYLNNAQLLRQGHLHVPQRAIEGLPPKSLSTFAYIPLGFTPVLADEMVPTYPIGLSLFIAGASFLTGWSAAAHVTMAAHAMLGLGLMYAFARKLGFSRGASAIATLLIAASPLYLFSSLQAMSDTPALVWTLAAVYFAWLSRERAGWSIAAGASVAAAVLVRPTNLLIVVPIALCLGFSWRRWLGLALGGLPGAVLLGIVNLRLYGRVATTGYGDVSVSFSRDFVPLALKNYVTWIPVLLTPAIVLVFALPWAAKRAPRPLAWVLAAWMLTFFAFYAFYYHTSETWWYLRFLLPAFPACAIAMLLVARRFSPASPRFAAWRPAALAFIAVAIVAWDGAWAEHKSALAIGRSERVYVEAAAWARQHLPANAVIGCMQTSGAMFHYTPFTLVRYDFLRSEITFDDVREACAKTGRPIYAALLPFETTEALERRMPGHWTQVGSVRYATFWKRDGDTPAPLDPVFSKEFVTDDVGDSEITADALQGWYDTEKNFRHRWIWSKGRSEIKLESWPLRAEPVVVRFALRSLAPAHVTISLGGAPLWQGEVGGDRLPVELRVPLKNGTAQLDFKTDAPPVRESAAVDARELAFAVYDLSFSAP